MSTSPLMIFHMIMGTISILTGMVGLFSRKGAPLHRKAGNIFFFSMLGMGLSGTYFAAIKPDMGTTISGLVVLYMLVTSQRTVKNKSGKPGLIEGTAMLFGIFIVSMGTGFGLEAAAHESGMKDGYPAFAYYIFSGIAALGVFFDVKMFYQRGIHGAQRIARHLGRMCYALLIAVVSLFVGQPQVFPKVLQDTHLLFIPVVVVFAMMIFWSIRVFVSSRFKLKTAHKT